MRRWHHPTGPSTILSISQTPLSNDAPAWLLGTNEGLWRIAPGADDAACQAMAEPLKNTLLTAVAVGAGRILVGAADGIAYSDDFGETWTAGALPGSTAEAPATVQVSQIVLSPNFERDTVAFAATTANGALRTTDKGTSWLYRKFGLADAEVTALALSPTYHIDGMTLAAVMSGLFHSTLGEVWKLTPLEKPAMPLSGLAFARNVVLAASETHGLYHSTNRGGTWSKRGAWSNGPISALAVSPDATKIGLATPQVVAWTDDSGETWTRAEGKTPRYILSLAICDDGTLLCGTQQDGLWVY